MQSRNIPTAANPRSGPRLLAILLSLHSGRFSKLGCSPSRWADPDAGLTRSSRWTSTGKPAPRRGRCEGRSRFRSAPGALTQWSVFRSQPTRSGDLTGVRHCLGAANLPFHYPFQIPGASVDLQHVKEAPAVAWIDQQLPDIDWTMSGRDQAGRLARLERASTAIRTEVGHDDRPPPASRKPRAAVTMTSPSSSGRFRRRDEAAI